MPLRKSNENSKEFLVDKLRVNKIVYHRFQHSVTMYCTTIEFFLKIKIYIILYQASAWGKLFVSLGGEVSGFGKQHVTPYMHSLVYHVPNFMLRHNGIRKFTGQGNNDCIIILSSNHTYTSYTMLFNINYMCTFSFLCTKGWRKIMMMSENFT